jgi:type II secretory pathway predicted ATPase ExeA
MYYLHFGLQKGLFGDGIAADTAVFRSPKHDLLIANFKVALASPSSVVALRGPAGVGKTTLTAAALRATSTRLALAWLNATPTNATELLELIIVELGIGTLRTTRIERLQLWRQFQAEMSATDSRLFVIAERTEDLSPEVLRALDSLTCADAAGNPGANVVLLGQPGLDAHLAAPALDSLRQRIRLRAQLEPFTEAELQDYLRHQVACAGGHYDQVFAPGAVAALHRYSGGVARVANNVCETALELAASQNHKLLTAELLTNAAVSLLGIVEAVPAIRPAAPMAAVTAPTAPVSAAAAGSPIAPAEPPSAPPTAAPPATIARAPTPPAPTPPPPTPPSLAATPRAATPSVATPPATTELPTPPTPPTAAPSKTVTPELAAPKPAAPAAAAEVEFDGGETDIPDVPMTDFPVLTDAVELPVAEARPSKRAVPLAPQAAPMAATERGVPPPLATRVAASAPAPVPPTKRIETAYTAPKGPPAATPPPGPAAPLPKPASVAATPLPPAKPTAAQADADTDDVLRQTQTMRAISVAKSIDDISSSMAETLFGDAELDLLTAAFASAAEWQNSDDAPPEPAAKPAAAKAPPVEDPFDLFDLGTDAPLELIDDSDDAAADRARKTATQS